MSTERKTIVGCKISQSARDFDLLFGSRLGYALMHSMNLFLWNRQLASEGSLTTHQPGSSQLADPGMKLRPRDLGSNSVHNVI